VERRRVVITGLGAITPIGNDVDAVWHSAKNGISGIDYIERFDVSDLDVRFGGEVRGFDPVETFGRREARRMDRIAQLAMEAARQAMDDSGLKVDESNQYDVGALIGCGMGGLNTIFDGMDTIREQGPGRVSPLLVPMLLPDMASGKVSIEYGLRGPTMSVATACATGNNAIGEATEMIRRGAADAMIAGSTEAGLLRLSIASFNNMRAISTRNDDPKAASRPFDKDRDGFVVSEGAAMLVIEELEFAKARGARIYAEVVGYGLSSDAFHITAPLEQGEGFQEAMRRALRDADLEPGDISYLNAHGTSTPYNDLSESRAVKHLFGDHAYKMPISSTKCITGHMMGAAASTEAVICVKAIENGFIPPTINLDNPDLPECDLDYVPHTGRAAELEYVMSNSFGFGGHNAVVIFRRYHENGDGQR
jgi:3-oxoacyl-[acyl-carrier-protein] synthase II